MIRFIDDDEGYLDWLAKNQDGYVINTYRNPKPDYVRLHAASCRLINGTPANGVGWTTTYIKLCGSRDELESWAARDLGASTWCCSRCL